LHINIKIFLIMPTADEIKYCREKEIYAYGTAWLFQQRSLSLRGKLKILSWLSLVVPILVGVLLGTFDSPELKAVTNIGSGLLGGILAVVGAWSVVAGWSDGLSKAERSMLANTDLCALWRDLQGYTAPDFSNRMDTLKVKDRAQESNDQLDGITLKDKACMMRAALLQYRLPCAGCGSVPTSLNPGNHKCAVCANT
jgi:mobilome CxxCx(11)CxxC protein